MLRSYGVAIVKYLAGPLAQKLFCFPLIFPSLRMRSNLHISITTLKLLKIDVKCTKVFSPLKIVLIKEILILRDSVKIDYESLYKDDSPRTKAITPL